MKPQCSNNIYASSAMEDQDSEEERCNAIESHLHEAMPSIKKADAERLARQLSILLHKQSPGISMKGSLAKEQLKRLSMRLLRLAKEKRRPSLSLVDTTEESPIEDSEKKTLFPQKMNIDAKVERHHKLINVVGEAKYDEINEVTKELRDIRKRSSLWTKYSHRFVDSLKLEEESIPASKGLPTAVYDVYFRIRLVDVMAVVDAKSSITFEETPQSCACIVERVDWDNLLSDAKEKLDAFRKLEQEISMESGEELTFQCSSGSCYRQL
eukprot:scaffold12430_cov137-Skeletonema_marinoi.AAC.5